MAQTHNVMPSLHMPLQSGSEKVLRQMRRSYRSERFLGILERVRQAMPHAAITTDIIVGFPGETEADFQATLDVARLARFSQAFTFQYSKRPGTPAAEMADQVPPEVVRARYERLIPVVDEVAWAESRQLEGTRVEVLLGAAGDGRKDAVTRRVSGRARDNRLVHVDPVGLELGPGDLVSAVVTHAAPHHLVADAGVELVRRAPTSALTAGADDGCGITTPGAGDAPIGLGMPRVGAPSPG